MSGIDQVIDQTEKVDTGKLFWQKERQIYADWTLAMWRELFQNSVDAGAKRIDIQVSTADKRGSFGHTPDEDKVTRLVFSDDGPGMDENTLRHVYFRPGETTKKDDSTVGGFGRARLLTCFSQVRFGIETRDKIVEGDGSSYKIYSRSDAVDTFGRWADGAESRGNPADAASAALLREEAARIASGPDNLRGCRFEIDVSPSEKDRHGKRADADGMRGRLMEYLAQSDVPCAVTIDGLPYVKPKRKVEGRRDLVATMQASEVPQAWRDNPKIVISERPDGRLDVTFARLAQIAGDTPEAQSSHLVIRVSGASMFTKYTSVKTGLFLDINPALAREVLTANRDSMKTVFQNSLDDLLKLMATDAIAALKQDQGTSYKLVRGGLGGKRAETPRPPVGDDMKPDFAEVARRSGSPSMGILKRIRAEDHYIDFSEWDWNNFEAGKELKLDPVAFKRLPDAFAVASFERTFLSGFGDRRAAESFYTTVRNGNLVKGMVEASGNLLGFVADSLRLVQVDREMRDLEANRRKLADLHDVPILYDNVNPPKEEFTKEEYRARRTAIRKAAGRYDPVAWDMAEGKGLKPRKTLVAWSVAVDHAVKVLMELYPEDIKPFDYSSGWVFSHPQKTYSPVGCRRAWFDTRAMARPEEDGDGKRYQFLLNPLDHEQGFKALYTPTDLDDMDALITLAAHEVAHVAAENHSDGFAYVFTRICEKLTTRKRKVVHGEMFAAMKAVDVAYANGRTRVASLDGDAGPRPFDRMLAGVGAGRDPEAFPDGLRAYDGPDGWVPGDAPEETRDEEPGLVPAM